MNKRLFVYFFGLLATLTNQYISPQVSHSLISQSDNKYLAELTLTNDNQAAIYHDFITISSDHPDVTVGQWQAKVAPQQQFDSIFNATKAVYPSGSVITVPLTTTKQPINNAHLYVSYMTNKNQKINETFIPLNFETTESSVTIEETQPSASPENKNQEPEKQSSWSDKIQTLFTHTKSIWIRLLLVFLMGILMSLTPCVYPMIPITVGILQSQKKSSMGRNFVLSLVYTMGIATTFAIAGVFAALTGSVCGAFMKNPFFVLLIVALLAYLGLSMFGLYDMYVPKFMRNGSQKNINGGSFISIFLFGVASGSVASPCLSPGLALLMSIVATIGSYVMGFLLLFFFGLGLGIPLVIIGTFSKALDTLPRAGMWMVEVKKVFGFMLFGMCFYYLGNIFPWHIILILMGLCSFAVGIYYLYEAEKSTSSAGKAIKTTIGIGLCAATIIAGIWSSFEWYKDKNVATSCVVGTDWYTDYEHARACAIESDKKLLVDFGADFCSLCKAINKKIFHDPAVIKKLLETCILVYIDGSNPSDEQFLKLQKQYGVMGFPTYLLLEPESEQIKKRWAGQLYSMSKEEFLAQIKNAA